MYTKIQNIKYKGYDIYYFNFNNNYEKKSMNLSECNVDKELFSEANAKENTLFSETSAKENTLFSETLVKENTITNYFNDNYIYYYKTKTSDIKLLGKFQKISKRSTNSYHYDVDYEVIEFDEDFVLLNIVDCITSLSKLTVYKDNIKENELNVRNIIYYKEIDNLTYKMILIDDMYYNDSQVYYYEK